MRYVLLGKYAVVVVSLMLALPGSFFLFVSFSPGCCEFIDHNSASGIQ